MPTYAHCQSDNIVKNGLTSHGKQNYRCHTCKQQLVEREPVPIFEREELLKDLLLERVSIRAIAYILNVSLGLVVKHAALCWQSVTKQLPSGKSEAALLQFYCVEADEMWTFVAVRDCPEWLWFVIERLAGLVVGFHLGSRNEKGALGLWLSIPEKL